MLTFDFVPELTKWLPYKLYQNEDDLLFRWLYVGNKRFSEPFFEDSLRKCKSYRENCGLAAYVTGTGELMKLAANTDSVTPTAFIFHVSRCGSTLLSQLLSLPEQHIVLSEVPLIDQVLRLEAEQSLQAGYSKKKLLKAVIRLCSQRKTNEQQCFVKLDSWHILFYDLIREAYPGVPFILQYRDPAEVVQSHLRRRGSQLIPGKVLPAGENQKACKSSSALDHYMLSVLDKLYTGLLLVAQNDRQSVLLNYSEGQKNWWEKLQKRIPISVTTSLDEAIHHRSMFHSKYPEQEFAEQNSIHDFEGDLAHLYASYHQMEGIRNDVCDHL